MNLGFKNLCFVVAGLAGLGGLIASPPAMAGIALKKLQVTDGSQLDLLFDAKVQKSQIQTDFFNDIIQISLNDASVYPAKILSVSGADLSKIFAYQYSPNLVRCRLSVRGKAENYKDRLEIKFSGKMMTVRILDAVAVADQLIQSAAVPIRVSAGAAAPAAAAGISKSSVAENLANTANEDRILLDKITKNSVPTKGESASDPSGAKYGGLTGPSLSSANLTSGKPLPSPLHSLGMLILVLGIFVTLAWIFKRVKAGERVGDKSGKLGDFVKSRFGAKTKMIEIVANHYLGPKKSISVARVCGRLLVLGVSNEGIQLITELPEGTSLDQGLAQGISQTLSRGVSPDFGAKKRTPSPAPRASGPKLNLGGFEDADDLENSEDADNADLGLSSYGFGTDAYKRAAVAAAQAAMRGRAPAGAQAAGSPVFSDVIAAEQARPSVRAKIKSRIEGMKPL